MKKLLAIASVLFLGFASAAVAADKADASKEKLVGVWEAAKGDLPKGSTVEFTKDGKIKIEVKAEGKSHSEEGAYELDGNTIKTTHKGKDGKEVKESLKIKKLTDEQLVTEDEKGKVDEFKRK
jgi:uncharacterized protein (TIGR03066 family)